jgi:hypothetical protein
MSDSTTTSTVEGSPYLSTAQQAELLNSQIPLTTPVPTNPGTQGVIPEVIVGAVGDNPGATPVSTLEQARRYYANEPLSTPVPTVAGVQQKVTEVQVALEALGVNGDPLPIDNINCSSTAASNNPNPNIGPTTNASCTTPPSAAGITAGTAIANANQNTVHVCDVCGGIGMAIAQARMVILKALAELRKAILDYLGLGDVEAQAKAIKAQIEMFKKWVKAIQDFIQMVKQRIKELEALINLLTKYIQDLIKAGLHELVAQFQQCLTDAKASYAAGVEQAKVAQQAQDAQNAQNAQQAQATTPQ